MIELIVVLGAFLVFWRYFSQDPPPNLNVGLTPITFAWTDDDSSSHNVDVSLTPKDQKESEESVQKADCFQELLSAPRTQHFPDATLKS